MGRVSAFQLPSEISRIGRSAPSGLENRLGGLGVDPWVCMAVDELPTAVFTAIDARDSHRYRRKFGLPAHFGLDALDGDGVGELGRDHLRDDFESCRPAVCVDRRGTIEPVDNFVPAAGDTPKPDWRG